MVQLSMLKSRPDDPHTTAAVGQVQYHARKYDQQIIVTVETWRRPI